MPNTAITYSETELKSKTAKLAREFNLKLITPEEKQNYPILLNQTRDHLELVLTDQPNQIIYTDFLSGKLQYRSQKGGGKKQLLSRAIGLHNKPGVVVCDITAGLGRDAFILATLGAKVTMFERSAIIGALLRDGWLRAQQSQSIRNLYWRFIACDAKIYLNLLLPPEYPEVIYFDPMFPERKKSALVKKEMRILREIIGDDIDATETLELALKKAVHRVVVKRPKLADCIPGRSPDFNLTGQSSRYDIYLTRGKS